MLRSVLSLAALFALTACSKEPPVGQPLPDAGTLEDPPIPPAPPDEGELASLDFVATASAPRGPVAAPAPPQAETCPTGWSRRALGEGATCLPPVPVSCQTDERLAIDGVCRPFGATCPADGWPANLPAGVEVRYVDPEAPAGGDGSLAQPFDRVALAVVEAPDGAVVALRAGDHLGPVEITRPIRLLGACATGTRIIGPAGDMLATVTVLGGPVELRELTVTGPRLGVQVGLETPEVPSSALLRTVRVEGSVPRGLRVWPQGTLEGVDVWVRGVTGLPNWVGIAAESRGGVLTLTDSTLEASEVGAAVGDLGLMDLRQVVVHDLYPGTEDLGWGCLGLPDSNLRLEEVWIQDVGGVAVYSGGLQASRVGVRGVSPPANSPGMIASGFAFEGDGSLQGISVQGVSGPAIYGQTGGVKLVVEDLYIADSSEDVSVAASNGAALELSRAWLEGVGGIFLTDAGTTGALQDITARAMLTSPVAVNHGAGPISVERVAIDASLNPVFVTDPSSQLTVRDLEVGPGAEVAVTADNGGHIELYRARIHSPETGLTTGTTGTGSSLYAEDVEVLSSNVAVLGAGPDGQLTLRRAVVDAPVYSAAWMFEGRADFEDLRVAGASLRPNVAAIRVNGAQARLRRVTLEEVGGSGLMVQGGAVDLEDLTVTQSPTQSRGFGVLVLSEGSLDMTRARIQGFSYGVSTGGLGTNRLRDVAVVEFSEAGFFFGDGRLQMSRARAEQGEGYGVYATQGGDVAVEDLVVRNIARAGSFGGLGVVAAGRAQLRVDRARVEGTGNASLLAAGTSQLTARDLRISDGLRTACVDPSCLSTTASGVLALPVAQIDIERFEILRMPTAGLHVFDTGGLDIREGLISECGVGLLVEGEDYDPARASHRVAYEGNGRAFLTREASIPPVRFEPETPATPQAPPGG